MPREDSEANRILDEYIDRLRLSKLGFTAPLGNQPAFKIDAFITIAEKLDQLQKEK